MFRVRTTSPFTHPTRLLLLAALLAVSACPEPAERWQIHGSADGPPLTLEDSEAEFELVLTVSRRAFPKEQNGALIVGITAELVEGAQAEARLSGSGFNAINRTLPRPGTRTFMEASLQYGCDESACTGRARQRFAGAGTVAWTVAGRLDSGLVKVGETPPTGETLSIDIVAVE